jgi:hypothetical protein
VPLTERAVEILSGLAAVKIGDFVFPGAKRGKPLSVMALAMVMRRMGVGESLRCMDTARHFVTGRASGRTSPARSQKPRLRMSSAMPPKEPTDAVTRWRNGAR